MLELERLTNVVEAMAQRASEQAEIRQVQLEELLQKLRDNRTNWSEIDRTLSIAKPIVGDKNFRAARPFDQSEPLDAAIKPVTPPQYAILNGVDGSQILPDRHAPYLYYLINVGVMTYYHGREIAPDTVTFPDLVYPENEDSDEERRNFRGRGGYRGGGRGDDRGRRGRGSAANKRGGYHN